MKTLIISAAATASLSAGVLLSSIPVSAHVAARVLVPDSSISQPLGEFGPSGQMADPFCSWSRIQIPTSMGLRWMAEEDCGQDGN